MKPATTLLYLFFSISINGQINITNLSLTDTTQNVFYIGVDNIIKISGSQYNPINQKHMIMGGGGMMYKKEKGIYTIRVQEETDDCQVWITENNKPLLKQRFIVRKVGRMIVRFGGLKDSTATINQLLVNPFIYVAIPGSFYKHNVNITSFTATFIGNGYDSLEVIGTGNRLTIEQIEIIKKLDKGDKIYFNQIYAVGPDSRRRKLPPFTITIK